MGEHAPKAARRGAANVRSVPLWKARYAAFSDKKHKPFGKALKLGQPKMDAAVFTDRPQQCHETCEPQRTIEPEGVVAFEALLRERGVSVRHCLREAYGCMSTCRIDCGLSHDSERKFRGSPLDRRG